MRTFRHVLDVGEGPPLLLLHGWSAHGGFFAPQLELAKLGRRIIVPDLPGHGQDRRPHTKLTIANLADGLDRFLAERDLCGVALVGWSMGAMVAFEYIARRGLSRLASLAVVDMSARIVNDNQWSFGLASGLDARGAEIAARAMARDWPRYARRIAPSLFAPGLPPGHDLLAFAHANIANNDGDTLADIWRSLAQADHRPTVSAITVPCLIIAGEQSQLYRPAVTKWLASHIPHSRHVVIPGAGHTPHLEQPARFNAELAAFLAVAPQRER
ncbi:MAG: alpha/beta hydrolase [Bradyrhizobiaceae bacterium]|nr:alpha/beta hydrolase [Bradyrhizobiaceae bacterium]